MSGESKNPDEVRRIVLEYLDSVREDGISREDFERIKRAMWGRYVKQFNNINSVAHSFLSNIFNHIGIFDFTEIMEKITLEEINQRLAEQFISEKSVLSVIEPA